MRVVNCAINETRKWAISLVRIKWFCHCLRYEYRGREWIRLILLTPGEQTLAYIYVPNFTYNIQFLWLHATCIILGNIILTSVRSHTKTDMAVFSAFITSFYAWQQQAINTLTFTAWFQWLASCMNAMGLFYTTVTYLHYWRVAFSADCSQVFLSSFNIRTLTVPQI
jgi:hypothetical protein